MHHNKIDISLADYSFKLNELSKINFGSVEGEKDWKFVEAFLHTYSIQDFFQNIKYNYILSPKGGGKSALFRAINEKNDSLNKYINFKNYSIIPINKGFAFDNEELHSSNFSLENNRKDYVLSWALYLLLELINDIVSNHKDKEGYSELIDKIKTIQKYKEKFNLYSYLDYLNSLNVALNFKFGGQSIDVRPKINMGITNDVLSLNEIFNYLDKFYKTNNITGLIIIDRIDNFIKQEENRNIQKNYIQGLIDCIEEISIYQNIKSVLFMRTDLFYSFEIDFEYDKVKERTLKLEWRKNEILSFIVNRLLSNDYIKSKYYDHYYEIIEEYLIKPIPLKKTLGDILWSTLKMIFWDWLVIFRKRFWRSIFVKSFWISIVKNEVKKIDLTRTYDDKITSNFLQLFFPKVALLNEKIELQKMDFHLWIMKYFEDANKIVNPRLLIYFFNELIKEQSLFNKNTLSEESVVILLRNAAQELHYNIFSDRIITQAYQKIQTDEILNILKLLGNEKHQNIFKAIHEIAYYKKTFVYQEINLKKFDVTPQEYNYILKTLKLLGYCSEIGHNLFEVPKLFQYKYFD